MKPALHAEACGLDPEGREEPLTPGQNQDDLVQMSTTHSQEGGFSAGAGIRAQESLIL